MALAEARDVCWPWRSTAAIVLFSGTLIAWLLLKPGSHGVFTAVDNVAQGLGPLLVVPLCFFGSGGPWRGRTAGGSLAARLQRWAPILLGLSAFCQFGGQLVYTVYQQVLHYASVPFPAWSDAVYLCEYPFLLLAVLLLPGRRLDLASRTRVLLDGVMILTAAITFSWYFILGPTFLAANASPFATAVGSAYPICDVVLISCLVLLAGRQVDPAMRRVVLILAAALVIIVTTDSIYDYQQLNSGYATGELLDVGWPLGYMLVGLAGRAWRLALAARDAAARSGEQAPRDDGDAGAALRPRLWRAMLPYALIPAVGVLLLSTLHTHGDPRLQDGVSIGSAILIGLVLLRQVMALRENNRLYGYLHAAYGQLEERNRETVAYAHNLERLNEELRDMHTNNRALAMANEQLEVMATTDALTGLPNRTLLHDRMQQALVVAQREESAVALLLMDLDRFKEVNDTLGHQYGDLLLQRAGERMQEALRTSDTVARLGGDEFAVLLPGADVAGATRVARLILESFETQIRVEGQVFDVDMSIGIAAYPGHGASPTELLRQADVAMYVAKRSHSGYAVYDAAQDHHDSYRIGLMSELRHAIAHDELALYYQPLVDMTQGDLIGAEALLRWQHPAHGLIPPDQFIPLAEHSGVIGPLTEWVLERALQQCQGWRQSGLSLGVQVNLSMRVLHDLHVPETVAALLQRYGIAPQWLTLEITESALMVDPGRALEVLTRLSALGVRIAIDDFGTGYSSLGYLKRLPVDEVKIDKSFVLGMDQDAKDATIVRSVIALAHAMGLAVVAEGIETGEALTLLRSLSCDVAQGYYLSRPLPGAEFERWVDTFSQTERRASA